MAFFQQWAPYLGALGLGFFIGWLLEFILDRIFWSKQLTVLQDENEQLQGALNRALNDKATSEQQMGRTLRRAEMAEEKVSNLHHQLKAVDDQRLTLDEELTQTSVRLRQMTAVEQANEALRNKLTATEMKARDLENDYSSANAKLTSEQTRTKVIDEEAATLRSSLDTTEIELERLSQEKAILRQRLADTEAEVATLNAQLETMAHNTDSGETGELRLHLDEAHHEIQTLKANLAAAPTVSSNNEFGGGGSADVTALEQRIETLETELVNEGNKLVSADVKLQNMADALTDERMRTQMLEKQLTEGEPAASDAAPRQDSRAQQEALEQENTDLRRRLAMAEQAARTSQADPRISTRRSRVAPASTTADTATAITKKQRLQEINGIGNVFAQRFNNANILTFAQLAALSPERIREIVQAKEFQQIDSIGWIAQAKELAQKNSS